MVGRQNATAAWCTAGFSIDYPAPGRGGQRISGFVIAAQCAQGDPQAPVSVMYAETAEQAPKPTKIGEIIYLTPGDPLPAVAGAPWTIPISPLAVFSSGQPDWPIPVDATVNGKTPPAATVPSAEAVERHKAAAAWTNSYGVVVTGRVLDRSATPELNDLPAGIERVVIAADDPAAPIDRFELGSPVTVELDGVTHNLGTIIGADDRRHWIVVDLIAPFLAEKDARLVTAR